MKSRPITILHVVSSLKKGGTERYLINLLQNSSKKYRNIVVYYYGDNAWSEELKELKVKVYKADEREQGKNKKRIKLIKRIIKQEQVDVVYSYTYYNSAYIMMMSFFTGVKRRITHSHRSVYEDKVNPIKVLISRLLISIFATDCLACDKVSGKSLFIGFRHFSVINNGINLSLFKYDASVRKTIRKKLKIGDDCILLGIFGRLDKNKNQRFAIDCLREFQKKHTNSKLLIIGDGAERGALNSYAQELGINGSIIFLSNTDCINQYYNALDLYLMTSIREGLPFVLIEAQANGLPILSSSGASKDAKINSNFRFASLKDGSGVWAQMIEELFGKRLNPNSSIENYSIEKTVKVIEGIYEKAR